MITEIVQPATTVGWYSAEHLNLCDQFTDAALLARTYLVWGEWPAQSIIENGLHQESQLWT